MGKVQCAIACLVFPKSSLNASREEAAEGVQEQQQQQRLGKQDSRGASGISQRSLTPRHSTLDAMLLHTV